MMKSQLVGLRKMIAELAAQGRAIRGQIQKAVARARYDLWNDKRSLGADARMALLAYAFLRDVPYRVVEPTAAVPQGRTEEGWRQEIANSIAWNAQVTAAPVAAWLAVPEDADRKARREAAAQAGYERGRARRTAQAAQRARGAA